MSHPAFTPPVRLGQKDEEELPTRPIVGLFVQPVVGKRIERYRDGSSPTILWAVRVRGKID